MATEKSTMSDEERKSWGEILWDYDFFPWSRLKPTHKKIEIVGLIFNEMKKKAKGVKK